MADADKLGNRASGGHWERVAREYLEQQGLETLLCGYNCRFGELDLVCTDSDWLVIVEVKARRSSRYASAVESVDPRKQHRVVLAARHLVSTRPEWAERPTRFDVVTFDHIESPKPTTRWIRHAFDASA